MAKSTLSETPSHPSYPADNVCPPADLPEDLERILSPEGELVGEPLLSDEEILEGCDHLQQHSHPGLGRNLPQELLH